MKKLYYIFLFSILVVSTMIAQEMPLRHSSVGGDGWVSCTPAANPNSARGNSHWIMYNLGQVYSLTNVRLWNFNQPDSLNSGVQGLQLDISTDGTTWNNIGAYTLPKAPGSSFYEGSLVTSLTGRNAKYVLITATSNFSGNCYGLSEVRFDIKQSALPVTITDLSLECSDVPILNWSVEHQKNIKNYTIEASNDANSWEAIKVVDAKEGKSYNSKLNGDEANFTYYRLIVGENDAEDWASIVVANHCSQIFEDISLHPNPATDRATLSVEDVSNFTGNIRIVDQKGSIVAILSKRSITNGLNFDLTSLTPGQYYLILEHKVKNRVLPIVKMQ